MKPSLNIVNQVFVSLVMAGFLWPMAFGMVRDSNSSFLSSSHLEDPLLEDPPLVIFFDREGGEIFPKCRVSVKKYPEILPPFITDSTLSKYPSLEMGKGASLRALESFGMVRECGAEQSFYLSSQAEYFDLYPQVAAGPAIMKGLMIAMNAVGCVLGFGVTHFGGWELAKEHENNLRGRANHRLADFLPTPAEWLIGGGLFIGPTLGWLNSDFYGYMNSFKDLPKQVSHSLGKGLTKQAKLKALEDVKEEWGRRVGKTTRVLGGAHGILCSVGGGLVGYFGSEKFIEQDKARQVALYQVRKLEQDTANYTNYIEQLEGELHSADEITKTLRERAEEFKKQRDSARVRLAGLGSDLNLASQAVAHLQKQVEAQEGFIVHLQEELFLANNQIAKEQAKNLYIIPLKERALDLEINLNKAQSESDRLKQALNLANNREKTLQEQLLAEQNRIANLEATLEELTWP